jgi:AcrR family transcriptional regulator
MSPYSNTEIQSEDTQKRILQAATQLFTEVGYQRATTRLIAEAAGVNEVTLFRHFGNKKALLMACVDAHNAAGFTATFESELSGVYATDIQRMAQRQIDDMRANVEMLRMLLCEARNLPELRQILLAGSRSNQERLSRYFQTQIESGNIRPELLAEALSIAFDSLFSSSILFEYAFQESPSPRLSIDELAGPLADLFVRGTAR